MKTSVSISVFPAPLGMPSLYSGVTEAHLGQIRDLGYDGVDLFVRDPRSPDTVNALRMLEQFGLEVGVVMPAALAGEGIFLSSKDPAIHQEALRRIGEIVDLAAGVGGMVSLGLVRGNRAADESEEKFHARFARSCEQLLERALPAGVPLVIEPINRYETNTLNSAAQAVDFLEACRLPLYLMLDTFHMNIEDAGLEETLERALPYTRHVHFLDSHRLAPSMGHLDMEGLYLILAREGYEGFLCLEALPLPDSGTCATKGAEFFRRMRRRELSIKG